MNHLTRSLPALAFLLVSGLGPGLTPTAWAEDAPVAPPPAITAPVPDDGGRVATAPGTVTDPWAPILRATTAYSHGDPTDEEQYYLELINRARMDPEGEADRMSSDTWLNNNGHSNVVSAMNYFGTDRTAVHDGIDGLSVVPPVAFNANLIAAARGHSLDMATGDEFQGHTSSNGDSAGTRITDAGYPWATYGENVYAYSNDSFYGHAGFEIDWGSTPNGIQDPPGHRLNIHNSAFREVGVGIVNDPTNDSTSIYEAGPQVVTQNFGRQKNTFSSYYYVLGVVYGDTDDDGFYSPGEGVSGVQVDVSGQTTYHAVTSASGGYAIPVPNTLTGSVTVTFSGTGVNESYTVSLSGSANVKVDHVVPSLAITSGPSVSDDPVQSTSAILSVTATGGEGDRTYTWSMTDGPSGATPTITPNGTTGSNTTSVLFERAGTYTFKVEVEDTEANMVSDTVTFDVNASLDTIVVSPSTAETALNSSIDFDATAYDQFNKVFATTISWHISGGGTIDSNGTVSAGDTAGNFTVTASAGGENDTATLTIEDESPEIDTAADASPTTVAGDTTDLSVTASDDGGAANLTYTWDATSQPSGSKPSYSVNGTNGANATTVTFDTAGSYTFEVTVEDKSGNTTTSSIAVTVSQTQTDVVVGPDPTSVQVNDSITFTATALDQFGDALSSQPTFTWSEDDPGSINSSSGEYTAPGTAGGPYTITATGGGMSDTASVTVTTSADTTAPTLETLRITISGTVSTDIATLTINGTTVTPDANGDWATTITVPANATTGVEVIATDEAGNQTTRTLDLVRPAGL